MEETLDFHSLAVALAELPDDKTEMFAVALKVPTRITTNCEGSRLLAALRYWIDNSEDVSWEAIAKALEVPRVDQRNLARKIRKLNGAVCV